MIIDIVFLMSAVGLFFLSGLALLGFIDKGGSLGLPFGVKAALGFMLGLGAVSLQMFFYSLASVPFNFPLITIPWAAVAAYTVIARRTAVFSPAPGSGIKEGFGVIEGVSMLIIGFEAAYALMYGFLSPVTAWDSLQTWFYKASVLFVHKGIPADFLRSDGGISVHPDYPLLIPLSAAWIYVSIGKINDQMARVIYPLQFLSLLTIFHYIVARASSRRVAFVFTALLSMTPVVMVHAAGLPVSIGELFTGDFTGYADLALSVYMLAGAGFLYLYVLEGRQAYMWLSAFFLGLGAWTKDEGIVFAITGGGILLLKAAFEREFARLVKCAAILAAVIAPWAVYKAVNRVPGEYEGSIGLSTLIKNLGRLPVILRFMKFIMFEKTELYNFTWYAYAASVAFNWKRFLARPVMAVNMTIFMQLLVYVLIYMVTFLDLKFHLETSFDRLALQLAPVAMFVAAVNFKGIFRGAGPQDAGRA